MFWMLGLSLFALFAFVFGLINFEEDGAEVLFALVGFGSVFVSFHGYTSIGWPFFWMQFIIIAFIVLSTVLPFLAIALMREHKVEKRIKTKVISPAWKAVVTTVTNELDARAERRKVILKKAHVARSQIEDALPPEGFEDERRMADHILEVILVKLLNLRDMIRADISAIKKDLEHYGDPAEEKDEQRASLIRGAQEVLVRLETLETQYAHDIQQALDWLNLSEPIFRAMKYGEAEPDWILERYQELCERADEAEEKRKDAQSHLSALMQNALSDPAVQAELEELERYDPQARTLRKNKETPTRKQAAAAASLRTPT